eukprot:768683-Hanusia_phi.AAC.8
MRPARGHQRDPRQALDQRRRLPLLGAVAEPCSPVISSSRLTPASPSCPSLPQPKAKTSPREESARV